MFYHSNKNHILHLHKIVNVIYVLLNWHFVYSRYFTKNRKSLDEMQN